MSDPYTGFPRTGAFSTILCDAPWPYHQVLKGRMRNQLPYTPMTEEAIFHLPVGEAAAEDALLLFWTTNAHMELAIECVRNYGFTTKTILTWGKITKDRRPHPGTGFWLRGATEHALLAVRGHPLSPQIRAIRGTKFERVYSTLLLAPRGSHSEKPDETYSMLEEYGATPRLELFARRHRAGWTSWGNHRVEVTEGTLREATAVSTGGVVV